MLDQVSVIIPMAPHEQTPEKLLKYLSKTSAEVILVSRSSRAASLNDGAKKATRAHLWFLHADSRVMTCHFEAIESQAKVGSRKIHYFDLRFDHKGLVSLNGLLANVRSRWLDLPYGDQGLFFSKATFELIGGFPETLKYGEDMLLIRKAKALGIAIDRLAIPLVTSARKYRKQGWLMTSVQHQIAFIKLLRTPL